MKEIQISRGMVALVDDEWFDELNKHKWYAHPAGRRCYAMRCTGGRLNKKHITMHRVILNPKNKTLDIDHINGNGLDNRRSNLRLATRSENMFNRGYQTNNKSGFKGVSFDPVTERWVSQISINRKRQWLGRFDTPEQAARAYDKKAIELLGEFAYLNFKDG